MKSPTARPRPTTRTGRRAASSVAVLLAALAANLVSAAPSPAADTSVAVDFSTAGGAPNYRASGMIYGLTPDGSLPPDHFFKDIKWHFERAGGAQLNGGGYATSLADYRTRWNATLAQYRRTVALGGTFVILPHDLWGADGTTSQGFPGDNGNWTLFDNFVNQLISDVKANNMTVEWDLWNEPDLNGFWSRSQSQYLQMWSRFHAAVRAKLPGQLIVGPSTANPPGASNTWWTTYLNHVKSTNSAPDIYSWHAIPHDPVTAVGSANSTIAAAGLSNTRPYQINEYAGVEQHNPGGGGWFISRLERAGADGLRSNWGGGPGLHDYAANLLTKNSSGQYLPKGEWFLYRYYGSQTGNIVNLTPGANTDGLATKDSTARNAKILLGSNGNTGNVTVNLGRLDTTSVPENGQVRAIVQRIPNNGGGAVTGPVTVSDQTLAVNNNSASVNVPWTDAADGYTVTLLPPSNTTVSTTAVVQHSGQCLDDTNLSAADGTQYQQYLCEGGYQQMLALKPVAGRANTYTVVNEYSGKCLDVSGASTADGAAVIQWTCSGGTNQMFTFQPVTALGNSQDYQLVAVHSGKCVDVSGVSTTPGALVHQWTCDPASNLPNKRNQIWRLTGKG
ncbi:broad specificity phosphatase PhoE [Streptomyces sp. TLI_235]|nr:RICIN domain-containing protein [Streptomyces sp. TLI_235]PBC70374.1 broad specificity phosphatase PhoE [Streptomyces sp. TLI_235]